MAVALQMTADTLQAKQWIRCKELKLKGLASLYRATVSRCYREEPKHSGRFALGVGVSKDLQGQTATEKTGYKNCSPVYRL